MRALSLAALLALGPATPGEATAPSGEAATSSQPAQAPAASGGQIDDPAKSDPAAAPPPESVAASAEGRPEAAPAATRLDAETKVPADEAKDIADAAVEGDTRRSGLEAVLPCGLHVITAQDDSLPVAAVVLSVEAGTRDDPEAQPGLLHALAFHMMAGNRELRPGQTIADVHDFGGVASMGIGAAQIRFESLVPYSQLERVLDFESQRFRAPSTSPRLWLKILSYARRDIKPRLPVVREAWAAVWQDPGLTHDGRQVPKKLGELVEGVLGAQIAKFFNYERATLVLVGPESPEDLMAKVRQRFADLPKQRRVSSATRAPWTTVSASATSARELAVVRQKGDTFVWPVPATPAARTYAEFLCGTLNRIPADPGSNKSAKVRCTYFQEPRRPVFVVRGVGADPAASIQSRLDRIRAGEFKVLLSTQAARSHQRRLEAEARPLSLAITLAQREDDAPAAGPARRVVLEELTGRTATLKPEQVPAEALTLFELKYATRLVAPTQDTEKAPATPGSAPDKQAAPAATGKAAPRK